MCGIAGIVNPPGSVVEPALLGRMIDKIRYRGPDDRGVYTRRETGLAHARLSIIDLAHGQQPMHNENQSVSITFNGEIFNYLELREQLIRKGRRFATGSDTEVVLRMYEEKGEDCVHDFNGQWAFAIWDAARRKLFASRDRMGVRPFFYSVVNNAFVFASEVKAIFAHPWVPRRLDLVGLDQIFTFWCNVPPRTVFEGIFELPPGHSLTVEDGEVDVRPYSRPTYPLARVPQTVHQEQEYAERLLELLIDATRIRLRADVPVGAYLSGGLDSSVVTAIIRRFSDAPLKTFSIAFDDPEYDESAHQREVARFLGTEHCEVRCTDNDIRRVFPDVVWHAEKPILRTAPAPLFLLSRAVRDSGYKVVLTGEGADEILGGYDIFKEAKVRRFCAASPASRRRPLLLKKLYPYLPQLQTQSPAYLQAFFHANAESARSPFFSHLPRWELTSKLKLFYSDEVRSALRTEDRYRELESHLPERYAHWDLFCQAQHLEAAYLLPGYILSSQGDRVAMAHAVEGRFPFLDHRVVELAASIPSRLKMKVLEEKYILKRCSRKLVPSSVNKRPKQPYRAPDAKSFVGQRTPDYVRALLSPEQLGKSGLFHAGAVDNLVEKIRRGRAVSTKDNMALVGILSTQLVVNQFIDRLA